MSELDDSKPVTMGELKKHCAERCNEFETGFARLADYFMTIKSMLKEVIELKELLRQHIADERRKEADFLHLNDVGG